jgi:hypothetical protein
MGQSLMWQGKDPEAQRQDRNEASANTQLGTCTILSPRWLHFFVLILRHLRRWFLLLNMLHYTSMCPQTPFSLAKWPASSVYWAFQVIDHNSDSSHVRQGNKYTESCPPSPPQVGDWTDIQIWHWTPRPSIIKPHPGSLHRVLKITQLQILHRTGNDSQDEPPGICSGVPSLHKKRAELNALTGRLRSVVHRPDWRTSRVLSHSAHKLDYPTWSPFPTRTFKRWLW